MANTAVDNMKLAHGVQFLDRLQYSLCQYAMSVEAEDAGTTNHPDRVKLANRVLSDPGNMASKLAVALVTGVSIAGTYSAGPPVDSTATDAAIFGQINAFWNNWFGVT